MNAPDNPDPRRSRPPTAQLSVRIDWHLSRRLQDHQHRHGGTQRGHIEAALREYLDRREEPNSDD